MTMGWFSVKKIYLSFDQRKGVLSHQRFALDSNFSPQKLRAESPPANRRFFNGEGLNIFAKMIFFLGSDSQVSRVFFFSFFLGSKQAAFFGGLFWLFFAKWLDRHSKWPPKIKLPRDSMIRCHSPTKLEILLAKQPEFHLEMWQHGKVFCLKTQHYCVAVHHSPKRIPQVDGICLKVE